ncbi:hypothetical protein Tco_1541308 [Tanacetum coccineum]
MIRRKIASRKREERRKTAIAKKNSSQRLLKIKFQQTRPAPKLRGKSSLQTHDEDEPNSNLKLNLNPEHQGEGEEYDIERAIHMSLESFQVHSQAHVGCMAIQEPVAEAT